MIATLTEKKKINKNFKNLFGFLIPKLSYEIKFFKNEPVINYFINKKVKKEHINEILKNHVNNVLCSENVISIFGNHLRRYTQSRQFTTNLCINAFLRILNISNINPENLTLTLLDLNGEYVNLLDRLIFYSKNISVVSNNLEIYSKKQEELLENYGASITLNSNIDWLFKSKILIAPEKIKVSLPLKQDCITFTSESYTLPIKGTIYHKFKLPKFKEIEKILPKDIQQEDFLAALYDICKKAEIKNLVPYYCFNGCEYISLKSISKKIYLQF